MQRASSVTIDVGGKESFKEQVCKCILHVFFVCVMPVYSGTSTEGNETMHAMRAEACEPVGLCKCFNNMI